MSVKVSVIMPSLNVGKYIEECLKSVMRQSLKDIEIICVDAGSTDGTLEILQAAAARDTRIKIINSDRKSYGYQVNLGLDAATGEYIGIVETDDWAEPLMFEKLYEAAVQDNLDVVKSDFWFYWSNPVKNVLYKIPKVFISMGVFYPLADFENFVDQAEFFNIKPSIWSAIYKRSFLEQNGIRLNETPGASFQDCGFNFKVMTLATRVRLVKDAYLHYRQDNEASSVNSPSKVYCVCDEYKAISEFIEKTFTGVTQKMVYGIAEMLKFDNYMWNYSRLSENLGQEFLLETSKEMAADVLEGRAQPSYFPSFKWEMLKKWVNDPEGFAAECKESRKISFFGRIIRKLKRSL